MAAKSKITAKPDFVTAKGHQKAPILLYWTLVWYLLLQLVKKLGFAVICSKRTLIFYKSAKIAISRNGTKMHFDECEFPWNGSTGTLRRTILTTLK